MDLNQDKVIDYLVNYASDKDIKNIKAAINELLKQRKINVKQKKINKQIKRQKNKTQIFKEKFLYVLKLQNNKYYVGITKDIDHRLQEHVAGKGSWFTKLYKPEKIIQADRYTDISENEMFDIETFVTVEYMQKYGINNVRGGKLMSKNSNHFVHIYNKYTKIESTK